jgi:hypothetical protein
VEILLVIQKIGLIRKNKVKVKWKKIKLWKCRMVYYEDECDSMEWTKINNKINK